MKYYFIYSAGGGAGDWNGVKRIWRDKMPTILKERVLLKFGDLFFNHASLSTLIKPTLWNNVTDMRSWLSNAVNDPFVMSGTRILLDSGTSKIVNFIAHNNSSSPNKIIEEFHNIVNKLKILEKYAKVIESSNIDEAVTFDVPNPFKIRTQSKITATAFFNDSHHNILIKRSAEYSNKLYLLLGNNQTRLLTIVNGLWSVFQINTFLRMLNYRPKKIAVAGLTRTGKLMTDIIKKLNNIIPFNNLDMIHFLGCGGLDNSKYIKNIYNGDNISVDNSTPMNRAIDGNTMGTSQSGYFDYVQHKLHRIKPVTINEIISLHNQYPTPIYTTTELKIILDKILLHQSGHSSVRTYDARAQLSLHNHDVFRVNAL